MSRRSADKVVFGTKFAERGEASEMMGILEAMAGECCSRNQTLRRYRSMGGKTLSDFIRQGEELVRRNREVEPLADPAELENLVHEQAARLVGESAAEGVVRAVRSGAVCTADHHGGLYFAQAFQGDILFSLLLERLGFGEPTVPILCAGQVELENASYARGICASMIPDAKQYFPIFPAKDSVQLASYAEPVNTQMLARFRHRFLEKEDAAGNEALREALDGILKAAYEREEVLSLPRFSDQVTRIGAALTGKLFAGEGKTFIYLEMESLLTPLLEKELADPCSLPARLLWSDTLRRNLLQERLEDGVTVAEALFWGADEKGRKFHLTLTPDGWLEGKDWRGQSVRYPADPASLEALLAERKIFPGVFLMVLISFFERSLTWLGGMFQSAYLPGYQRALVSVLERGGLAREARTIGAYDCSGYISGPVFGLYRGNGFAAPAAPVEAFPNRLELARIREMVEKTDLWDAHLMGLADIYFDLIGRKDRKEDWYAVIGRELYDRYPDHRLTGYES